MIVQPNDQIKAEEVARKDDRLTVTKDANLATREAIDSRLKELEAIKNSYLLVESRFSASRLINLARSYRGKIAFVRRRINALRRRLAEFPEGLELAHAAALIDNGRIDAALLADKTERGDDIPDA